MATQKNIFITGSSKGLGKAAAQMFQARGWGVAATMRNPAAGADLAALDRTHVIELDVADPAQIEAAAATAIDKLGHIDVVFNNAGYGLAGPFEGAEDERVRRQLDTNLLGVLRTTRAFLPHLRARRAGLVITTTSIGGLIALPFNSVYHATKWALEGWSESMWHELRAHGIGIKTVSPGGIATDFATSSLDFVTHDDYTEQLNTALASFQSRGGDYSTAEQIAEVVYEAATDGKDQLRYVAGKDANAWYQQRLEIGDQAFMEFIHQSFLGDAS